MTADWQFTDLRIAAGFPGFPELVAPDKDTFFVCDWTGVIRKVDWQTQSVTTSPSTAILGGAVGNCLRSLCGSADTSRTAAATTAPWAAVWDLNTGAMDKIHSASGSKVNAVTFSPDGRHLVLGLGYFPLNPAERVEAGIEIWSCDGEWEFVMAAALPGVCVECLTWHETANTLVALTGRRTQDSGYTSFLHGSTLRPVRVVDRSEVSVHICGTRDWPAGVAIVGKEFTMSHCEEPEKNDWNFTPNHPLSGACLDEDDIVAPTGHFLDSFSGQVTGEFPPLKDCCGMIVRPGGGYVGLASDGVLRVWEGDETE